MSRKSSNTNDIISLHRTMDGLTIDPSKLRISFKSRDKFRVDTDCIPEIKLDNNPPLNPQKENRMENRMENKIIIPHKSQCTQSSQVSSNQESLDVIVEIQEVIRAPCVKNTSNVFSLHGWMIPAGFSIFGIALALSNLIIPNHTGHICVILSPLPMLCLIFYAFLLPSWINVSLLVCAWLIPVACSCWHMTLSAMFSIILGCLMALSAGRALGWIFLVMLFISTSLLFPKEFFNNFEFATDSQFSKFPIIKWGVTLCFFSLLALCIFATSTRWRVVYKFKVS